MSSKYRNILVLALVVGALLGFAVMSGIAIRDTIKAKQDTSKKAAPEHGEPFTYVASILAGLVGGIVAAGFGQSPPSKPGGGAADALTRNVIGLGDFIVENKREKNLSRKADGDDSSATSSKAKEAIGIIYAAVYFLIGVANIGAWIYANEEASILVKNLATVSIGLFVSIVTAFFRDDQPTGNN
ncbi:MAG TPA: hypothetical protein VE732_06695 [Nitrososphaera sp.]|nr:hypothetical protein [Nitrososphaera sp.]